MAKKFNIYLQENDEVLGGYLTTINGTKAEAVREARRIAMENIKYNDYKSALWYRVEEEINADTEDENLVYWFFVMRSPVTGHINIKVIDLK